MVKKSLALLLALTVLLLAGCGSKAGSVWVQRADQLAAAGQTPERYAGMVVSEDVVEITRDVSKKVEELYVKEGQEVKAGDKLFTYDSAALELELEKTRLEVEKLTNEQQTYTEQLEDLEAQLKKTTGSSSITRLTLEINTLKTTMLENEYNLKAKTAAIADLEQVLANIHVLSPVDGTVRKIDEQGNAYITIQQSGAYRVQGAINEMSMTSGQLYPGCRVRIYSRISDQVWEGTVLTIDLENASQNNSDYWGGDMMVGTMTTSSSYAFYVEPDSVEGLLLGQHVYIEVLTPAPEMPGLWLPESFIYDLVMDEQTFTYTGSVWAANGQKLEQRSVVLGMYDYLTGCYEVLEGLSPEDYVADPVNPACAPGAPVQRREAGDFGG